MADKKPLLEVSVELAGLNIGINRQNQEFKFYEGDFTLTRNDLETLLAFAGMLDNFGGPAVK